MTRKAIILIVLGVFLGVPPSHADLLMDFNRAITLDPGYFLSYVWRGGLSRKEGKTVSAKLDLERSLRINFKNPLTHYEISQILRREGKTEEALTELTDAPGKA